MEQRESGQDQEQQSGALHLHSEEETPRLLLRS
jgi:hypothetical protein